jgi:hypothetical protein
MMHSPADASGVEAAERVRREIEAQGMPALYAAFSNALHDFEASGYRIADILPSDTSQRLGLTARRAIRPDGKTFWNVYSETVCDALCRNKNELNSIVKKTAGSATASLVTYVLAALSLPPTAVLLAATIAGILLALGVDAFCKYQGKLPAPRSGSRRAT